ncbi:MAG: peptidase M16 [Bacteroidia bacterium]|nr:MAG: peptidase M16 [Bacteroidia bacterium]
MVPRNFSSTELAEKLDGLGSEISTSAGYEQSTITLSCPAKHIDKTLPLLLEVYQWANFPEDEFTTYQQRMIRNLEIEEKKTNAMATRYFLKRLWGSYPYGKKVIKEDFQSLTIEEVHEFHKNEILKNDVYLIVSGNFEISQVHSLIEKYFGSLELHCSSSVSKSVTEQVVTTEGLYFHEMPNQVQSSLRIGHLSIPKSHEDYEELQVLGTLLGGFFGSRLMKNIREDKGYTYGIYGGFIGMKQKGYFMISTDVANEYVDDTLKEIYKEISRLQNEKVGEEELQVVKNYLMGNLLSSLETPFQVADTLSLLRLNGLNTHHLQKTFERIKYISPERILELAQKYLKVEGGVTVIAGSKV